MLTAQQHNSSIKETDKNNHEITLTKRNKFLGETIAVNFNGRVFVAQKPRTEYFN